jgi:hypothetical protein
MGLWWRVEREVACAINAVTRSQPRAMAIFCFFVTLRPPCTLMVVLGPIPRAERMIPEMSAITTPVP